MREGARPGSAGHPGVSAFAILRASERIARPWKNGGGVTYEIATFPPGASMDDFEWRVSIAEVRHTGLFSRFAGIERILLVLSGQLRLDVAGEPTPHTLDPGDQLTFSGEAPVVGGPCGDIVKDLNVMFDPKKWHAKIERFKPHVSGEGHHIAVAGLSCPHFAPMDALVVSDTGQVPANFVGHLISLVRIHDELAADI